MDLIVTEAPYSDSGCIKKEIVNMADTDNPRGLSVKVKFLCHSTNWSAGTLHIDVVNISLHIWTWEWFWAYRMIVNPPKVDLLLKTHQ